MILVLIGTIFSSDYNRIKAQTVSSMDSTAKVAFVADPNSSSTSSSLSSSSSSGLTDEEIIDIIPNPSNSASSSAKAQSTTQSNPNRTANSTTQSLSNLTAGNSNDGTTQPNPSNLTENQSNPSNPSNSSQSDQLIANVDGTMSFSQQQQNQNTSDAITVPNAGDKLNFSPVEPVLYCLMFTIILISHLKKLAMEENCR